MRLHFASVWEAMADCVGDAAAITQGEATLTWTDFEDRAARLASAFHASGLRPNSKVGLYLYNGPQYLEANFAALKMRGVPINVNYRYLDEELWYVLDNADVEALVLHESLAARVERVRDRLPKLKLVVVVDEGGPGAGFRAAEAYEHLIGSHQPMPRIDRSEDDVYMLYTGGTTGRPKGVMQRIGDFTRMFIERGCARFELPLPRDMDDLPRVVLEAHDHGRRPVSLAVPPLMHGTGLWLGSMMPHCVGGKVVLLTSRSFDGAEAIRAAAKERVGFVVLVGDAMSRPILRAAAELARGGECYDLTSIHTVYSSGAMWSAEVKSEMLSLLPGALLFDGMGSTEGGMGAQLTRAGDDPKTARFALSPTTKVFTEDGREVVPGSGEAGLIASGGATVPLGYYKDPEKSARTFREIDGVRYSFPGDWATVEPDGTLTLLGRGNNCINTGGEKVFPEEVEEVIKRIDGVEDCVVLGMPHPEFGTAVCAVVGGIAEALPTENEIVAACRETVAGYKAPRRVRLVAQVPRLDNGKPDYASARALLEHADSQPSAHQVSGYAKS